MRTEQATVYVCECCDERFTYESDCLAHEPDCFELKRQREEHARRSDKARRDALELARVDRALRLLVEHGYEDTARIKAYALLDGLDWTPDSCQWWTATVDKMVKAAREAAEEEASG